MAEHALVSGMEITPVVGVAAAGPRPGSCGSWKGRWTTEPASRWLRAASGVAPDLLYRWRRRCLIEEP